MEDCVCSLQVKLCKSNHILAEFGMRSSNLGVWLLNRVGVQLVYNSCLQGGFRTNGDVKALFSGSADALQRCHRGPPNAVVTGLLAFPCDDNNPGTGFQHKPTVRFYSSINTCNCNLHDLYIIRSVWRAYDMTINCFPFILYALHDSL